MVKVVELSPEELKIRDLTDRIYRISQDFQLGSSREIPDIIVFENNIGGIFVDESSCKIVLNNYKYYSELYQLAERVENEVYNKKDSVVLEKGYEHSLVH